MTLKGYNNLLKIIHGIICHPVSTQCPPSVHKVLLSVTEIIKHVILLIEQTTEDAQEAKNKNFKFAKGTQKQNSKEYTNED